MEFRISKEVFYEALSVVNKAVSLKVSLTALTGIRLEVNNKKIVVTGANSDIFLMKTISMSAGGDLET